MRTCSLNLLIQKRTNIKTKKLTILLQWWKIINFKLFFSVFGLFIFCIILLNLLSFVLYTHKPMYTHIVICSAMKEEEKTSNTNYFSVSCFLYSLVWKALSSKGLGVRLQVKDSCTFDYFKRKKIFFNFFF